MKTLLLLSITGVSLVASTLPLHVELDIYSNKAFLNKTYELSQRGKITTKVPIQTTLENVRYKLDKQCQVDNHILSNTLKEINPDIENLRKQRAQKLNEVESLIAKDALLRTLSLEKVEDFSKIEKISSYLTKNLVENFSLIENLKKDIEEIDNKIKNNEGVKEQFKELITSYTCNKIGKKLEISYPQNSIKYTPFYNVSANINNKSLTIEKKMTLFYKGVEDYQNIDLNIYSYRYNQNVAPQQFYPKYLGQKREILYAKSSMAMESIQKAAVNSPRIQHKELATKSLYKIEAAKLESGEKNLLHVDKEIVNASFKTIIDAYGTNKAYMQASIKTKKDYSGAHTNYFLNQNPIAARYMGKIYKGKETKLYFGEDEHIQIDKELIKTLDEKTFFGDDKISTQNWKYTITNKKPYSTNIEFIERTPVSKDEDIKVKTLAQPKFDSQSANGKTTWNFNLEANGKKNIIFGYEISNSK